MQSEVHVREDPEGRVPQESARRRRRAGGARSAPRRRGRGGSVGGTRACTGVVELCGETLQAAQDEQCFRKKGLGGKERS